MFASLTYVRRYVALAAGQPFGGRWFESQEICTIGFISIDPMDTL